MAKRATTRTPLVAPTTSGAAHSRMRLKQSRLKLIPLAVAQGTFQVGVAIANEFAKRAADSPYEPYPINEGLPRQVGVLVYVANQKVHGWSRRGDQPKKPRAARDTTKALSVVTLVGVGWPGRINETGTVNMPAHPAFVPARDTVVPHAARIVSTYTKPLIGSRDG